MKIKVKDPIIKKVVKKFVDRSNVGFKKYGVTLQDDKSNMDEWLNHLQEELMDAVNYIERARYELKLADRPDCCKKYIHCNCGGNTACTPILGSTGTSTGKVPYAQFPVTYSDPHTTDNV